MVSYRLALRSLFAGLLLVLIAPGMMMAQRSGNQTQSKVVFKGSPAKIMEQANYYYSLRRYKTAKEGYQLVLNSDPKNFDATLRSARCANYMQEYQEAVNFYESALDLDENANDTAWFELGILYRLLDRQNDAREKLTEFRKRYTIQDEYAKRVKLELQGCDMVEEQRAMEPKWRAKPTDFNSPAGDQFPSILAQSEEERFVVFTSHRSESMGEGEFETYNEPAFSDLYIVKIENDSTFSGSENMGKKVNVKMNNGTSTFTPDGLIMYYSICNQGKLGYGCSIYRSKYDPRKKAWGKPKAVEELKGEKEIVVDSRGKTRRVPTYDVQPFLSADGNTMYFVSDRDGGQGKLDVWSSTFEGETWGEPVNLGPKVNTPFSELSPAVNATNDVLYYASNGKVGFGGYDLYMSSGTPGNWGEAENLGSPINSTYDDFGGVWMDNDSLAYFTSNRPNGSGRDDIYWARKIPAPDRKYAIHGIVIDRKTGQPVPFAKVFLYRKDFEGDLIPMDTITTGQDAAYAFDLDFNFEYKIVANAPEYLVNEKNFDTKDREKNDIEMNIDIDLERIVFERPIVLNNIYYDFDKSDLRPESKMELDKLAELLNTNKHIRIQIGSHTDSNGSEDYNKKLSEARAKSVVDYLVNTVGISGDRLSWFGFGESQLLIYPEMSDEDEQMNRRSEFRIMSIDYNMGQ